MEENPGTTSRKRKRVQVTKTEVAEESVTAASDVTHDHPAFSNELIVKGILNCLSFKDLLYCSLVNRKWNFLAREVLRKRNCLAAIRDENRGSDVKALGSLVSSMIHSPFRGLSVHLYKNDYTAHCPTFMSSREYAVVPEEGYPSDSDEDDENEPPEKSDYTDLLDADALDALSTVSAKLDTKYLKLTTAKPSRRGNTWKRLRRNWGIAHAVLKSPSSTVQGICIDIDYDFDGARVNAGCEIFKLWLGQLQLPNIKTLELFPNGRVMYGYDRHGPFVETLLGAAPNLQNLHYLLGAHLLEKVVPWSRTQLVKDFRWVGAFKSELSRIEAFSLQEPKLEKLQFSTGNELWCGNLHVQRRGLTVRLHQQHLLSRNDTQHHTDGVRLRRVCTLLIDLLRSSQNTLKKLSVGHHDLILMVSQWQWDMPVLHQVKELELSYNQRLDDEGAPLAKINFDEYFPQLVQVSITEAKFPGPFDFFVGEDFRSQTSSYSCSTVTTLHFKFEKYIGLQRLKMCQKLFPNVEYLHLEVPLNLSPTLPRKLWTVWPDLISLEFSIWNICDRNFNMEILGISMEDDDKITEGNAGDSAILKMVPVSPCLFSLPKLQRISFRFTHSISFPCKQDCTSEPIFLSAAAVPLIRSRMPGLYFEVERKVCSLKEKCHLALTHLGSLVESVERVDVMADIEITCVDRSFTYWKSNLHLWI